MCDLLSVSGKLGGGGGEGDTFGLHCTYCHHIDIKMFCNFMIFSEYEYQGLRLDFFFYMKGGRKR